MKILELILLILGILALGYVVVTWILRFLGQAREVGMFIWLEDEKKDYVCECKFGKSHVVADNDEWETLYFISSKDTKHYNSILNKDCPHEPMASFPKDKIIAETEHMFLVRR
jgi:hypothetical protein